MVRSPFHSGSFQTAARIKQTVCLVRDLYIDSEVLVSFQKSENLIGKVVYIDYYFIKSCCFQF